MEKEKLRNIFTTHIRPKLEYASPVWSPHLQRLTDMLEKVQQQAKKIGPEVKEQSY